MDTVREMRLAAGLTQKQAAALARVSERMWQVYEACNNLPQARRELFEFNLRVMRDKEGK